MATERFQIEISERGSRTVRRELDGIGGSATRAESSVQLLRRALRLIGGGLVVREMVQLADTYTNLGNHLRLVTTGTENLARVTDELFASAQETRSSFEGTANMYARVALSAKDLGRSQEELIQFTKSLNQATILSGASAQEAYNAMLQLSQGIASNTLQGDELRAVLEQLPMVADVIAQHMGVTRGELRKMGQDGKISALMVLDAFKAAREELDEKFANTIPTIGQAMATFRNNVMQLWGEFTTSSGAAEALAKAIMLVGNNLENIVPLVLGVVAAFAAWKFTALISAAAAEMIALQVALGGAGGAAGLLTQLMKVATQQVVFFNLAVASNPIGAFLVALTAAAALLYIFSDDIKVTSDGVYSLRDAFVASFQIIAQALGGVLAVFQTGWATAVSAVESLFEGFGTTLREVLSAVGSFAKAIINAYIGMWVAALRSVQLVWGNFPGFMDTVFTGVVNLAAAAAELVMNAWQLPFRGLQAMAEYVDKDFADAIGGALDSMSLEIPRRVAGESGRQFAEDWAQAAKEALGRDYLGEFGDAVMAQMQTNAAKSRGELNPAEGGAAGAGGLSDEEKKARAALRDFLRDLEQEIVLLGLSRREREKMQMIFRLENQMKRELTNTERELVSARIEEMQAVRDRATIASYLSDMREENELLQLNRREREIRTEVMRLEHEIGRQLTDQERAQIESMALQNQGLRERRRVLDDINGPMEDIRARQEALNQLFTEGAVGLADYEREMRRLVLASTDLDNTLGGGVSNALVRLAQEADHFSARVSDAIVGMSDKLADSISEFVKTGKMDFKSLADFAVEQFVRIMTQQLIAQSIGNLGMGFGLPGFANGGSFTVGGSGGTDSKLVAFRATPGERVDVSTPNQQRGGDRGGNNYNISVSVRDSGDDMTARRTGKAVAREVGRALQRVSGDLPGR